MSNKLNLIVIASLFFLAIVSCTLADVSDTEINEETVRVLIIGSAEHPDPVLEMIWELEKKGILQNVIVLESFPVQMHITGPRSIIEKLKAIPKKESPSFK